MAVSAARRRTAPHRAFRPPSPLSVAREELIAVDDEGWRQTANGERNQSCQISVYAGLRRAA